MSEVQPMNEENALAEANALGSILTAPPHASQVDTSLAA